MRRRSSIRSSKSEYNQDSHQSGLADTYRHLKTVASLKEELIASQSLAQTQVVRLQEADESIATLQAQFERLRTETDDLAEVTSRSQQSLADNMAETEELRREMLSSQEDRDRSQIAVEKLLGTIADLTRQLESAREDSGRAVEYQIKLQVRIGLFWGRTHADLPVRRARVPRFGGSDPSAPLGA